jgi:uncharacterized membrane protein
LDELILILIIMAGIFLAACSCGLVALGKIIDRYPAGREETREQSLSSPANATKLMAAFVWILFACGAWAALLGDRLGFIFGIAAIAAACLFVFTGLVFSFVVLAMMRRQKKTSGDTTLLPASHDHREPKIK